jgi:hypothetical protein
LWVISSHHAADAVAAVAAAADYCDGGDVLK